MSCSITSKTAQTIVNVLKDTINYDITFMDNEGRIIACSNVSRVGRIHGGSVCLLNSGEEKLVVNSDDEYEGTLKGVNMVLRSHGEVIGVVGVTGDREEVDKYGAVVQRMTELLLLENEYNEQQQKKMHSIIAFLQEWLFQNTKIDGVQKRYALTLGINMDIPRSAAVCSLANHNSSRNAVFDYRTFQNIDLLLRELLGGDHRDIWFLNGNQLVLLLAKGPAKRTDTIRLIWEKCRERLGLELYFGCSVIEATGEDIREQYKQAGKALYCAGADNPICYYSEIDVQLLLKGLPEDIKSGYIKNVFSDTPEKDVAEFCQLINAMAEYNGSITRIADSMGIHKNTIQYRIQKMKTITGYDCRNLKDFAALYMAERMCAEQKE